MFPKYRILTEISVLDILYENDKQYTDECTELIQEQDVILKANGFEFDKRYKIHLLDDRYKKEMIINEEINEAVQYLSIKDGYDLVKFENGNYGFVAYYNGTENGFEILRESEDDEDEE
jgi:hypothetical protein